MGVSDSNETARKWPIRIQLPSKRTDEADAFVEMWKKAWMSGADTCWASQPSINPNAEDPTRAAWQAGWDWAKVHPNRRKQHHLRLAHPNRRATDLARRVPRAVKIGTFGIGLLAASRWLWRTLRSRKPGGATADSTPP
jgi:hypothetical protein